MSTKRQTPTLTPIASKPTIAEKQGEHLQRKPATAAKRKNLSLWKK